MGSNAFLPSNEVSQTLQLTDDLTEIFGKHTFKMGFEWQHVKFTTLQPPWSHGQYNYDGSNGGAFTDIVGSNSSNTGRAEFLLIPTTSTVVGGVNNLGGANQVYLSNIALTNDGKNYWGGYVNDSWKVSSKLTVNLGLRYDYFWSGRREPRKSVKLCAECLGWTDVPNIAGTELEKSFSEFSLGAWAGRHRGRRDERVW